MNFGQRALTVRQVGNATETETQVGGGRGRGGGRGGERLTSGICTDLCRAVTISRNLLVSKKNELLKRHFEFGDCFGRNAVVLCNVIAIRKKKKRKQIKRLTFSFRLKLNRFGRHSRKFWRGFGPDLNDPDIFAQ